MHAYILFYFKFAPDDERRCPTSLRIDVDELFTPIKKGKFISLTLNFYKE